jgi:Zn-dependent protease/CBS domain-containing protein
MRWSFRIARIAGIDVKLHLTFLLVPLFFGYRAYAITDGSVTAVFEALLLLLLLFGSVLLHEFGHALAARHYGIQTADITLLPIGGVARLERMPEEPLQELFVAVAGPLVNVVIILGLGTILGWEAVWEAAGSRFEEAPESFAVLFLMVVNVNLLLFNLIPAFPLDGGRVLRALLTLWLGHARATRTAASIGQIFAVIFGLAGLGALPPYFTAFNPMLLLIAFFIYSAGTQEATAVQMRHFTRTVRLREAMMTDFRTLPLDATLADAVELLVRTAQHDFPVVDAEGQVQGVLTRQDLIAGLGQGGPAIPVQEVMRREVPTVHAFASFEEAFELMQSSGSPALPVVDGRGRLVGLITPDNVGEMLMVHSVLTKGGRPAWRTPADEREIPETKPTVI